ETRSRLPAKRLRGIAGTQSRPGPAEQARSSQQIRPDPPSREVHDRSHLPRSWRQRTPNCLDVFLVPHVEIPHGAGRTGDVELVGLHAELVPHGALVRLVTPTGADRARHPLRLLLPERGVERRATRREPMPAVPPPTLLHAAHRDPAL